MKKIISLFIISLSMGLSSCSDEDKLPQLPPLTEVLEDNEIRIVFSPTAEQAELNLEALLDGGSLDINWGEDDKLHTTKQGEISHVYAEFNRDYTISIRPQSKENNLTEVKISKEEVATRVKSFRLGKSPKLESFSMHILDNMLERFDLSQNPQFFDVYIFLYINKPNFVFDDFKNFSSMNFDLSIPRSVTFDNLNAKFCQIFYSLPNFNEKVDKVSLTNCNIETLNIMAYTNHRNQMLQVNNLDLSGSNVEHLQTQLLYIPNTLDLSTMNFCKTFQFYSSDADKIKPLHTLLGFDLDNYTNKSSDHLEEVDVRVCTDLSYFQVMGYNNLKAIHYNKTDKLSWIQFANNQHLENYSFYKDSEEKTKALSTQAITERTTVLSLKAN